MDDYFYDNYGDDYTGWKKWLSENKKRFIYSKEIGKYICPGDYGKDVIYVTHQKDKFVFYSKSNTAELRTNIPLYKVLAYNEYNSLKSKDKKSILFRVDFSMIPHKSNVYRKLLERFKLLKKYRNVIIVNETDNND